VNQDRPTFDLATLIANFPISPKFSAQPLANSSPTQQSISLNKTGHSSGFEGPKSQSDRFVTAQRSRAILRLGFITLTLTLPKEL